jgi:aminomethyltransferase
LGGYSISGQKTRYGAGVKITALNQQHHQLGATFISFAGWEMPLHYGSQIQEHLAVRNDAGIFDVSHMLAMDCQGEQVKEWLRTVLSNDINKLHPGKNALYSCLLNPQGGVIDDLIVYHLDHNLFRLVVNAGCAEKDVAWLQTQAAAFSVQLTPRTDLSILSIQGPHILEKLQQALTPAQFTHLQTLQPFDAIALQDWMIARTGYTGEEQGFEIILPHAHALSLWEQLLQAGIAPIGLGARDSLRLEAGFNLYGHEMDESVTPLESNLGWVVDWSDPAREFIGKKALQAQRQDPALRQLVGLVLLNQGICRAGMKVMGQDTQGNVHQGTLTSGSFSPILSRAIGFARMSAGIFSKVTVDIRGKNIPAQIIKPPFVRKGKSNVVL